MGRTGVGIWGHHQRVHVKVWEIELHAVFSSKEKTGGINKYVTQDNMHAEGFWGGVLIFATFGRRN